MIEFVGILIAAYVLTRMYERHLEQRNARLRALLREIDQQGQGREGQQSH